MQGVSKKYADFIGSGFESLALKDKSGFGMINAPNEGYHLLMQILTCVLDSVDSNGCQ